MEALRQLRVSLEVSLEHQRHLAAQLADSAIESSREITHRASDAVASGSAASIEGVRRKVTSMSEESRRWAAEFLSARLVQGQYILTTAHPFVVHAVDVSQPYAVKAASAVEPYVTAARPYVEPVLTEARRV